jgi:hypothetical protein
MNSGCNQLCPYNTLEGCKVKENNGVCPISNKAFGVVHKNTLVKTGDWLDRNTKLYEVVIADDNIFVACPLKYSKKEKSMIVKYSKPEIYANQEEINTLTDLDFDIAFSKRFSKKRF